MIALNSMLRERRLRHSTIAGLLWIGVLGVLFIFGTCPCAWAQDDNKPAAKRGAKPPPAAEEEEIPKDVRPEDIGGSTLVTQDGVALGATFFPSEKKKEAVPVILLHSWKGGRWEYASLAIELWNRGQGYAVLVPDLRGHGQSKAQYVGNEQRTLDASKFLAADFGSMVKYDMETLKKFLVKKNNAGELNLEKLCIVGSEMGASVALNWALLDWSWPNYAGVKQGQSVKGLVLLSPQRNFKGLSINAPLNNPVLNAGVSMMLLVGNEDSKLLADVQRIHTLLERFHPAPTEGREETEQTLFFMGLDTKVQGAKLLADPNLAVPRRIKKFIDLRLAGKDYPWIEIGKKPGSTTPRK